MTNLSSTKFHECFTSALPADAQIQNVPRRVAGAAYSWVLPEPVAAPRTLAVSQDMLQTLGWGAEQVQSEEFAQVFAGNRQLPGMRPYAMCYGGHQFGQWAGQLGDGRVINLGEVITANREHFTLQLKGAGPTPYSRRADGRAVLRSSVREFLCSEAMHHLGVPTTRALSLVATGDEVQRDMFYDGHPQMEPGAVVCRVAPSFIRFGHFELPTARDDIQLLEQYVRFSLEHDFKRSQSLSADNLVDWFREICTRTAEMIVHWMRVGFVHGVMNTDNMSILGLTIDYGPYGWLEDYDPHWTPNTTDASGRRYCYGKQPEIAQWNLMALANALYPLIREAEPLESALNEYAQNYQLAWRTMMCAKLGLKQHSASEDEALIHELLELLNTVEADWTLFYRALSGFDLAVTFDLMNIEPLMHSFYQPDAFKGEIRQRWLSWLTTYQSRVQQEGQAPAARIQVMNSTNPIYVLRNYLAQQAIDAAEQGDLSHILQLQKVLQQPYTEHANYSNFALKRPEWARNRAGCSMLSCSS